YNLGIGQGLSVKQVIDAAKDVTGADIKVEIGPRRAGDPPMLYANADKIKNELGWSARHTDIREIVQTAWTWFKAHPSGYDEEVPLHVAPKSRARKSSGTMTVAA